MDQYNFQYCQKIVVFSQDEKSILLCKRKNEKDFNGLYSFIGGKLERKDSSPDDGLRREKDEEVGVDFKLRIYLTLTTNYFYIKKDGTPMVLPHYFAQHISGDIKLNTEEYADYKWVKIEQLNSFKPKMDNVPAVVELFLKAKKIILQTNFIII